MEITFNLVEEILKQLPISYYLKRKTPVSLSKDEETSFIDLVSGGIVISYPQIANSIAKDTEELEKNVRVKLYHEVSHAMLSPRPKELTIDKDIFNCFEDERIEFLLNDYYLDVNFKENLLKNHSLVDTTTPFGLFYYCIRLRGGGVELNQEINDLILKWKNLRFDIRPQNLTAYQEDIIKLYRKIIRKFQINKDPLPSENEEELSKITFSNGGNFNETEMEVLADHVEQILGTYRDRDFLRQAELIINSRNSERANNSESKNTYSGRLNPKMIGRPNDDYKWFMKKGDGLYRDNQGLKLNLFIDQSGSYRELEINTNSILKELCVIERKIKDFKFDLVVIDTDIELKSKNHRFIECGGGNCLSTKLLTYFNHLQELNSKNVNLVLLNGDMATDTYKDGLLTVSPFSDMQYHNLHAFNSDNTIIISDNSNKKALEQYCKRAKIIYTKDYVKEFKKYILKSLKILIK